MHGQQSGLLEIALFAVHIGRDLLKRQGAFDEHDLAVGAVRNALGFDVERFDFEQVEWIFFGRRASVRGRRLVYVSHAPIVSGCRRSTAAAQQARGKKGP